ncbi:hypothetical protein [Terasakiella pusilla]
MTLIKIGTLLHWFWKTACSPKTGNWGNSLSASMDALVAVMNFYCST